MNSRATNSRVAKGFTLVEVMVALAVVAIALPALMVSLSQQIDATAYLRDKSLAQMVASNKLTEVRILTEASRRLPVGKASGVAELAQRQWYWWRESQKTELPDFYRIEIKVALDEEGVDEPLITLSAFMSGDLELDSGSAPPANGPGNEAEDE